MKKFERAVGFFLGIAFVLMLNACATPNIMINHNPEELMKIEADIPPEPLDFHKKSVMLVFVADKVTAPTGAYIDDYYSEVNPVEQSYVIPEPGHVLFEKIADSLKEQNASVYRKYSPDTLASSRIEADQKIIALTIDDLEFHMWKTKKEGTYYLGRADISYTINSASGNGIEYQDTVSVKSKVSDRDDVFKRLAQKFVYTIAEKIY